MDSSTALTVLDRMGRRFNPWWEGIRPETGVPRERARDRALGLLAPASSGDPSTAVPPRHALAIVGMRQVGKSTLMRQVVDRLIEDGRDPRRFFFVNFEDPVFIPHRRDPTTLDVLFEAYRGEVAPAERPYLLLDEVQNLEHWAQWVRTAIETRAATIVLSGSSSKLLEPELASVLTGRTRRLTLGPFSFREALRARRWEPDGAPKTPDDAAALRARLRWYLERGGLPAAVLSEDSREATDLLGDYFRDIVHKDVVARHRVRSVRALEEVAVYLLQHTGSLQSFNKLKDRFQIGLDQAKNYTRHLIDAHMLGELVRYERSYGARVRARRKFYARDTGLRNAVVSGFSEDLGHLAETVVHNALVDQWPGTLFFLGDDNTVECDFVLWDKTSPVGAIQVCYAAGEPPDRERRGLLTAMNRFGLSEGLVLTDGVERDERVAGQTVRYRPIWKWLLDPGPVMLGRGT